MFIKVTQAQDYSNENTWHCLPESDACYACDLLFSSSTAMKVALHVIHECILYARFYGNETKYKIV